MRKILFALVLLLCSAAGFAQNFWSVNSNVAAIKKDSNFKRSLDAANSRLYNLDRTALRNELFKVVDGAAKGSTIIAIPNADGQVEQFEMAEASNFEPGLQAKYPEIRCFAGKGITDPTVRVRLAISPEGVQAVTQRIGMEDEVIEAYSEDHNTYAVYKTSAEDNESFSCGTEDELVSGDIKKRQVPLANPQSRNYFIKLPLVISVNALYAQFFKAEKAADLWPHINNMLATLNLIFERDLAIRVEVIKESENVFFYKKENDPYVGIDSRDDLLRKVNETISSNIENGKYSIGHLLCITSIDSKHITGTGTIGVVCLAQKGRGFTSFPTDPLNKNVSLHGYVFNMTAAHEMGHQLGASHTFSHKSDALPVEPASGVTIMSYAGIAHPSIRSSVISFFHAKSIEQIKMRFAINECITTPITNIAPEAKVKEVKTIYNIPQSTPFALIAKAGTDPRLTYSWEQIDKAGPDEFGVYSIANPQKLKGPNFVSWPPSSLPFRLFPRLSTILAGEFETGPLPGGSKFAHSEALSSISRELNFRLTVRDNIPFNEIKAEGPHTSYVDVKVKVGDKGPFKIISPDDGTEVWKSGKNVTISWDKANSDKAPVSCAAVRILLSTDGGYTFPHTLAENTPNTGTATVTVPSVKTTAARVKVEAIGNIFFDICDKNFNIDFGCELKVAGLTSVINQTSAVLKWWKVADAVSYDVEFQEIGKVFNGAKFEKNVSDNFTTFSHWYYSIGSFYSNTCKWRVRAICSNGGTGEWTVAYNRPPSCSPPAQETLNVSAICQTEATFNWVLVPGMTGTYLLWYKEETSKEWTNKELPFNISSYLATNLKSNTTYIWKMESKCNDIIGLDSIEQSFTTK